jgi:CopC domain
MSKPAQEVESTPRLQGELFSRRAEKDGRAIAVLRAIEGGGAYTVEYEVRSVDGDARRGSYRFDTRVEASRFVDEATLALQYLGCSIH